MILRPKFSVVRKSASSFFTLILNICKKYLVAMCFSKLSLYFSYITISRFVHWYFWKHTFCQYQSRSEEKNSKVSYFVLIDDFTVFETEVEHHQYSLRRFGSDGTWSSFMWSKHMTSVNARSSTPIEWTNINSATPTRWWTLKYRLHDCWATTVTSIDDDVRSVMADFGQTDFGQTDFGQLFDPLWPIWGLTDFGQTDFGQF